MSKKSRMGLAAGATFIVVILFTACDYARSTRAPSERVCRAFLKQIDMAKTDWAAQEHKTTNDTPTDAELFGPKAYLRDKAECPEGGTYTLGRVGKKPRCSVSGYTL